MNPKNITSESLAEYIRRRDTHREIDELKAELSLVKLHLRALQQVVYKNIYDTGDTLVIHGSLGELNGG